MLLVIGWNPWMSHQMPQARRYLDQMSKDHDKLLVVIDPRRSETAERAVLRWMASRSIMMISRGRIMSG